jgi:hypothetical protein
MAQPETTVPTFQMATNPNLTQSTVSPEQPKISPEQPTTTSQMPEVEAPKIDF